MVGDGRTDGCADLAVTDLTVTVTHAFIKIQHIA